MKKIFVFLLIIIFTLPGSVFAAAPNVITGDASSVTNKSATLSLKLTETFGEDATEIGFDYGLTTSYGQTVSSTGAFSENLSFIDFFGENGGAEGEFQSPYGLAIDDSDNIYVSEIGNYRVQKFDSNYSYLFDFGSFGSSAGQFRYPTGIDIDSQGNIFVADYSNGRVQKFNSSGNYVARVGDSGLGDGLFYYPFGLAIDDSDNIYVSEEGESQVEKFDSNLDFLFNFGSQCCTTYPPRPDGEFEENRGVHVDSSGYIYVIEAAGSRGQKFDSAGNFIFSFGSYGTGPGQINSGGSDLVTDRFGNIFVVDSNNDKVIKFDSSGDFIWEFGSNGSGDGQFDQPGSIDIDSSDNIYVTDVDNDRVQVFSYDENTENLTGLSCGTTYHYRAFATNEDGTSYGDDATFSTSACDTPYVLTDSAVPNQSSVTLYGEIEDIGTDQVSSRGFEYGETTSYGATISESGSFSEEIFSLYAESLSCGTTYHYRAFATNEDGTSYGDDATFSTSACPQNSSSGGSVKYGCKDENAINYDRFSRHDPELCRYETDNFVVTGDYAKPLEEISCTPFTTLMKLGSKQGEVSKLQQTLNSLGFNTGPVDGWFGNLTNAGVKAFQASQNIDADGIVGPVTRGKLNGFCGN